MSRNSSSQTKNTVYVALFAAMIAAMGLLPPITVGIIPVPITLQTLGVMLAGALLGPWRGAMSSLVVVVLAIAGLPLLSGGRGGWECCSAPPVAISSAGYSVHWLLACSSSTGFFAGLEMQRDCLQDLLPSSSAESVLSTCVASLGPRRLRVLILAPRSLDQPLSSPETCSRLLLRRLSLSPFTAVTAG